jgi:ATP-dependent Clp protease ATP-binding subunit ClpA
MDAVEYLVKKGFNSKMGARPLFRIIEEEIKRPLSKEILFGKLTNGGVVNLTMDNDKFVFDLVEILPVEVKSKPELEDEETIN